MELTFYNTLSRKKELFKPLGKTVGMYICGPTVYHFAHIGNLRTYVFGDILRRTLEYNGFPVNHVMNITDVGHLTSDSDTGDDKMEKGAAREGKTVWEVAKFFTDAVLADLAQMNVLPPTTYCKATDHIPEQIALIRTLEEKGFTYTIDDGIYFDTSKFPRYADFARLRIDELEAGARVEMVAGKRSITDFALWKFSTRDKKRQMEWESPWGTGFPGWHLECSAMAMKYLGETFDIHCGAIDLIPVHHTNEIAQSETATGKRFVNYWMHGEFIVFDNEKMSKSGGTMVVLKNITERGIPAPAYRFFLLSAQYRAPLSFSWETLENSAKGYASLVSKIQELRNNPDAGMGEEASAFETAFLDEINDDLNMPRALAVLWDALKSTALSNRRKLALVEKFDQVLGLGLKDIQGTFVGVSAEIEQLLLERTAARKAKNWAESDHIRDLITQKGYRIIDTKEGAKAEKI
ncbi:MAG: cysteine--tRNA ligase [Fibrobacterota bacterium]